MLFIKQNEESLASRFFVHGESQRAVFISLPL